MVDDFKDPLDEEYKCPNCDGLGGFDEGGVDGVMRGSPDDYTTCFNCGGGGSIEPTHHPGEDGKGAVSGTVFDTREEQHMEDYDAENSMPFGNMAVQHGDGEILDPKRMGYSKDGRMKQTRYPIGVPQENKVYHPELQHREPAVYTREWDGQPTNTGLSITGASHPLFTRADPMTIAWTLLKEHHDVDWYHGTSRMNEALAEGLQPKGNVRYEDNTQAPSPALFFTTNPAEARGFAQQSKSNPNEKPGVVKVRGLKHGQKRPMHGGYSHFIARKPIDADRLRMVGDDDGN